MLAILLCYQSKALKPSLVLANQGCIWVWRSILDTVDDDPDANIQALVDAADRAVATAELRNATTVNGGGGWPFRLHGESGDERWAVHVRTRAEPATVLATAIDF